MISITDDFPSAYPGASLGLLALGDVANPPSHPLLEQRKSDLEGELRQEFGGLARPA